ncbi:hypothetical protein ACEI25_001355 [Photobacterium damselae]
MLCQNTSSTNDQSFPKGIKTELAIDELVEKMQQLSDNVNLPQYYKEDIDRDFKILCKYGSGKKYIWLLRNSGSLLFPLKVGLNTNYIDVYLKGDQTARCFYVDSSNSDLVELTHDKTTALINELPICVNNYDNATSLIAAIERILSDSNVTDKPFMKAEMGTTAIYWNDWVNWFNGDNDVMCKLMSNAINVLNSFK